MIKPALESRKICPGLVFWLRQFKPVLEAGLPQMPNNVGLDRLGFVKDVYRRITHLSP
jgi:hypothetical protein